MSCLRRRARARTALSVVEGEGALSGDRHERGVLEANAKPRTAHSLALPRAQASVERRAEGRSVGSQRACSGYIHRHAAIRVGCRWQLGALRWCSRLSCCRTELVIVLRDGVESEKGGEGASGVHDVRRVRSPRACMRSHAHQLQRARAHSHQHLRPPPPPQPRRRRRRRCPSPLLPPRRSRAPPRHAALLPPLPRAPERVRGACARPSPRAALALWGAHSRARVWSTRAHARPPRVDRMTRLPPACIRKWKSVFPGDSAFQTRSAFVVN